MKVLLTVAGFDPTGGAGVTADSRILGKKGFLSASVVTSIISQTTTEVEKISILPKEVVRAQFTALSEEFQVDGIKTGVLANKDIAMIVWGELRKVEVPIVVDPVLRASSGVSLFEGDYRTVYFDFILSLATLVTPNIPEAEELTGISIENEDDMAKAAERIMESGVKAVLIKGGHFEEKKIDFYMDSQKSEYLEIKEPDSFSIHGTGCVLAALVLSHLVEGGDVYRAVISGREEFLNLRRRVLRPGRGDFIIP